MNASGEAVAKAIRELKINIDKLIVIYDDMDIPFGKIKLKRKGGSAGHRGIDSIIEKIGTDNFIRVRVGIGKDKGINGVDYVLSEFTEDEEVALPRILNDVRMAVECIILDGIEKAMNTFNKRR